METWKADTGFASAARQQKENKGEQEEDNARTHGSGARPETVSSVFFLKTGPQQ